MRKQPVGYSNKYAVHTSVSSDASLASSMHVSDARGEGLRSTGQPAASAGATLQTACMSG